MTFSEEIDLSSIRVWWKFPRDFSDCLLGSVKQNMRFFMWILLIEAKYEVIFLFCLLLRDEFNNYLHVWDIIKFKSGIYVNRYQSRLRSEVKIKRGKNVKLSLVSKRRRKVWHKNMTAHKNRERSFSEIKW